MLEWQILGHQNLRFGDLATKIVKKMMFALSKRTGLLWYHIKRYVRYASLVLIMGKVYTDFFPNMEGGFYLD